MSAEISSSAVTLVDPARTKIAGAIRQASGSTGASFEYLLATAKMESNFNPQAAASTSSAKGLFQFIDQTWLGTVKEAGAQLGYGDYADAISKSASGSYSVSDPAARQAIMDLRNDPVVSSAMAGALTQSNSFKLTAEIGRRPSDSELYMAHFMGVGGASRLINAAQDNPNASAVAMFPNAAAANQSIFYDRSGNARSVAQVYGNLDARYNAAANSPATQTALASAGGAPAGAAMVLASARTVDNAAYLSSFPDVRTVEAVRAVSPVDATASSTRQSSEPMFRTLFQGGDRSEPVSPAVQQLWGGGTGASSTSTDAAASGTSSVPATGASSTTMSYAPSAPAAPTDFGLTDPSAALSTTPTIRPPRTLDLFSDRNGTFAG
ncbi:transglycosylase SLT domain-containing protein [Rhodopseudomonas palustris]|uniref:transglycosylase SLT domain-containing protein n=1 Tax=Rhodopseudomonas palustris TaxID=1076 RepID=UPI002ACD6591|nr:transglycosylase SLT domain-containing protein [Rhodopseudomonas palustris]WQH01360.1 transglycosylase SLT domain-containing protein [Rhodopseudomonas palustris]